MDPEDYDPTTGMELYEPDMGMAGEEQPDTSQDFEAEDGAMLPGEVELPFDGSSPGSGSAALASASDIAARSLFGRGGVIYNSGDNLGTSPAVQSRSEIMPYPVRSAGTMRARGILGAIAQKVGKRIGLHAIAYAVAHYGIPAAAAAFGVGASDLLFLIGQYSAKRSKRHRGPHLSTVLKRIKKGQHYEKLLRKYAAKAHVHHARPAFRKRKGK
jgi:hypothetical protein